MLKFWKNAGKGKTQTRPPENQSPNHCPSPSGSSGRDGISLICSTLDLENIDENSQEEKIVIQEWSRLSKNVKDTLRDKHSLAYFIDFMESISASVYVEFWLDAEKFKDAAKLLHTKASDKNKNTHQALNRTVSFDSSLVNNSLKGRSFSNGSNRSGALFNEYDSRKYPLCNVNDLQNAGSSIQINGLPEQKSIKNDLLDHAVSIFKKYIALESPSRLDLPDDVRSVIISLICHPEGVIDPDIFKIAQDHILDHIGLQYFEKYTQSDYHCKYQLDILTSGSLTIEDIIYNQMALFYFMEFLEQEQSNLLLEFVMAVVNFKEHLIINSDLDPEQAQNDAIVLYDKYFSLQATHSLGFSSDIRFHIEENICKEGGPSPDCFHKPFRLILNVLKHYITSFLTSQIYYKYLTELVSSIQGSWQNITKHKKSASDCSSEMSLSTRNTLGTMSNLSKNNGESTSSMRIDLKQLYNGDLLWRRKSDKGLCLGRVNSLGRFESSMEPDPEKKDPSIIKRVVNKLVHGEKDKAKEELAWQVAHMIVKDVTDVTMGIPEGQL